jgi:hypothetical protein
MHLSFPLLLHLDVLDIVHGHVARKRHCQVVPQRQQFAALQITNKI